MKPAELKSPVVPDPDYAALVRESQAAWTAKKRNYHGLGYQDPKTEIPWQANDSHRAALIDRIQQPSTLLDEDTRQSWRAQGEREHEKWLEEREQARLLVQTADASGVPVPDKIRRLAAEEDRWAALEAMREAMTTRRTRTAKRVMSS
jgi:hypothetical protein